MVKIYVTVIYLQIIIFTHSYFLEIRLLELRNFKGNLDFCKGHIRSITGISVSTGVETIIVIFHCNHRMKLNFECFLHRNCKIYLLENNHM